MRRLVYSPYVQAFINSDYGVIDVSPYIVSGSVDRKVNQVSTAQLTLRNPVQGSGNNLLFTEHLGPNDTEPGPLFHPMDPIIILMTRIQNHPVQVFTGYLDTSPYLQLYPGLCTLTASCTLKRLLYTQWDAALPFVQYFLAQFGWLPNGDTGMSYNPSAEAQKLTANSGILKGQFNDGSLGALLFTVLNVIGQWDASTIWIEALPPEIKKLVVNLYHQIQAEVDQGEQLFESLITQILGSGSQGTGSPGAASGPVTGAKQIVQQVQPIAAKYNVPLQMVLATMYIETGFSNKDTPGNPHYGWFQAQIANAPYAYGTWSHSPPSIQQTHDLGLACTAFCSAAAGWAAADPSLRSDIQQWAMKTQGVTGSNNPYYITGWPTALATANSYISQFATGSGNTTNTLAPGATGSAGGAPNAQTGGSSPGGKTGSPNSTVPVFPLQAGSYVGQGQWTPDQGIDIATNGGACGANAPLLAIANGTVVGHGIGGFGPDAPTLKLDTPIQGQSYVYYGHSGPTGAVPIGTHVTAGQIIGSVGCGVVGISSGPHLEIGFASDASGAPATGTAPLMLSTLKSAVAGQPVPGGGSAANSGTTNTTTADAFSTFINLPSVFTSAEALAFTGKRSFMADQPLFPFVEQLCQASLRNFMSMPNGNFFAFFPDYFGLFGRKYYWEIQDIEIIDGRINLSDDPLATHIAVVGDVTQLHATIDVFDQLMTSGIFTIFDAFASGYVSLSSTGTTGAPAPGLIDPKALQTPASKTAALNFLKKYGARPYVDQVPMIRSAFFELFFSFQKFMILWSKQFETTFELTFMPELFPGGLVGLPDHHLQLYVEEVSHNFDFTSGFTTTVNFSSPSKLDDSSRANLSDGMARKALTS